MTQFHYLTLAFAFVWIALAAYLILMNRRLARLREEIEELRRRRPGGGTR